MFPSVEEYAIQEASEIRQNVASMANGAFRGSSVLFHYMFSSIGFMLFSICKYVKTVEKAT
jgi:hypothetical protein